jgi:1-acyl-sn-glycerol-3-phosphate acyltransferase
MLSPWVGRVVVGFVRLLTSARVIWRGCQPSDCPRVYFANHTSHGDFVLIWSSFPPWLRPLVRPVAGADYWLRGRLRRFLIYNVFNGVLIDRDSKGNTHSPIETLIDVIDGGQSLIFFPEGTRNLGQRLLPFKSGIYHLAEGQPGVELVPVWIDNLQRVMPKGRILPLPLMCTVTFGAPIRLNPGEQKQVFLDRARQALLELAGNAQ